VNWSAGTIADVPKGVVTKTLTVPAAWAGAVAVIEIALLTVNEVAGVVPKVTLVTPAKQLPVMVTEVPAVCGPAVGEMPATAGIAV